VSERRAVAHTREFLADTLTPVAVYRRLGELSPVRFLFESITGGEQVSRYTFLGAGPRQLCRLWTDRLEIERGGVVETRAEAGAGQTPLEALRSVISEVRAEAGEIPFLGGWVGYFGYELAGLIERLPTPAADPYGLPLAWLGRFDRLIVFDHVRQRIIAVAAEIEGEVDRATAERDLDALSDLLTSSREVEGVALGAPPAPTSPARPPSLDGAAYRDAVRRAKEYIAAGDIFQTVLARRWSLGQGAPPLLLYRAVRLINPSPYMVLLETPQAALVGSSPEMLVRKVGRRIETRPIAGTRPRHGDPLRDVALAEELLADAKERAEHLMLVDLGRNDLGRVAAAGSVRVPTFMEIERYSHVMHIESQVVGELAHDRTALDALLACFPAGTVSGAPKIRAMEIIAELEPERRGPYAGAVGYLSFTGDLDTCITIRTLVVREEEISVSAGAGIVADSDPAAEERETENKVAALLATVSLARSLG
jgi:anthranilate synthase component I